MVRATGLRGDEFGPRALAGLSRLAARRLAQAGVDPEPLLAAAGLSRSLIEAPGGRVDVRSQLAFVDLAAQALGDELLGFHMALDGDLRELGAFYYVMASAPTLGEALAREERYSALVNEGVRTRFTRTDKLVVDVEYVGLERRLGRHEMEFWLACTVRKSRLFTSRELVPAYVGFMHGRETDTSEIERYLGCAPEFRAAHDRVCFDGAAADLPQVSADPYLQGVVVRYLDAVTAGFERRPDRLRVRVENAIMARLPHGTARIAAVAQDLGMSTRTLSRRLAAEGESFGAILDKLRSDLAARYLQSEELSMAQIGWLLGYTEQSSFVRAVQRWTGKSPRDVRRQASAATKKPPSGLG